MLATDGLTEVRNRAGRQLLAAGAMELIERAGPHAQQLADELVAAVRRSGGKRLRDDLAILAIRSDRSGAALVRRVALALLVAWLATVEARARPIARCIAATTSCSTARPTIRRC